MRNKYDLVIFDVDGTLLDTTEGVISSVKYTIDKMGFPMPDEKILESFIGPPIQDSFARTYHLEGPILQEIATIFRNQYSSVDLLKAVPYEGIYSLLEDIRSRGMKIAIATYKREDYAISLLKHYHFDNYTDIMYGGDHENKLKKKDIIEKCIKDGGNPDLAKVVMVGDTVHDALGALQIGTAFIGVTFGFGFHCAEDLVNVQNVGVASSPVEILKYL